MEVIIMKKSWLTVLLIHSAYFLPATAFVAEVSQPETAPDMGASADTRFFELGPTPTNLGASACICALSAYVWRGQVLDNRAVIQPQVELTKFGFFVNAWGNMNLTDHVTGRRGFSEIDLAAGYDLPLKPVSVRAGVIDYSFPNTSCAETREAFTIIQYPNSILTPRFEGYYDFGQANGAYLRLALEHEIAILEKLRLTPGFSSGFGTSAYNDYYFAADDSAFNDGNAYASLVYRLLDDLTLNLSATYVWLWDRDIRAGAENIYFNTKQWVLGAMLSYAL